jgi:cell division protein FtsB
MKLSNKIGLIAGAIIIIAALVSLYIIYSGQAAERDELTEKLETAQARLPVLAAQKHELEDELASAQSSLDASQAQYPQDIHSIEYGEHIFEIVEECSLTLASLVFPKPAGVTQGSVTYRVVSLTLPVTGTLENIFKFLDTINTDQRFASTQVKSVVLSGGGATIAVDIYGYKG